MKYIDRMTTQWLDFPDGIRVNGRLVVIPDVHGYADLLHELLTHYAKLPQAPIGSCSQMVFTGDLIDRGRENFRCMDLARSAQLDGSPAIILPGNHEGMMADALNNPDDLFYFKFWYECGGHTVMDEVDPDCAKSPEELIELVRKRLPDGYLDYICRCDGHFVSGDLLMVHALIIPPVSGGPAAVKAAYDEFFAKRLELAIMPHWAWLRRGAIEYTGGWEGSPGRLVVHGHTIEHDGPIETEAELIAAADRIQSHKRINLDIGSYKHNRLCSLEAIDGKYRFHMVAERRIFD